MDEHGALVVAKKKKSKPTVDDGERKPIIVQMTGSDELREAVKRLAEFDGRSVASLTERALRFYAKHIGFPEDLPRR